MHSWSSLGALLGHNLRTDEKKVSFGTDGAHISLGHSWSRVKIKVRVKVRY